MAPLARNFPAFVLKVFDRPYERLKNRECPEWELLINIT